MSLIKSVKMDIKKIDKIFFSSLNLKKNTNLAKLEYGQQWDSVAHMLLISHLEKKMKIAIDIDDVLDMSSYNKAIKILKKYLK